MPCEDRLNKILPVKNGFTLCLLGNSTNLFLVQDLLFRKILSGGIPSECQTIWTQIGPDLGPNCLQRLSSVATSRHRVNQNYKDDVYPVGIQGQAVQILKL